MARCRISPSVYLQLLDEKAAVSRIEEEESRWLGKYYEKPGTKDGAIKLLNLFAAIRMAVDKLSPNVVSMLKFAAFMDNTNIPLLVLTEDPTNVTPRMRQENADALESEVEGLSLATVEGAGENRILSLHRVTQTSMQLALTEEEENELVQRLLNTLLTFFVKDNRYSCSGQLSYSLMPHVETVLTHACRISRDDHHLTRARLYEVLGFLYTQRGMAAKAEGPLRLAKKLLEDLAEVTLKEPSETAQGQPTGETSGEAVEQEAGLLFEKLTLAGQRLPDNVFSQILQNKVLVDQDIELFRRKLPTKAELDQICRDKQPLSPAQLDLLVRHGLVLPLGRLKEIYLSELHVSINYSLGRCYFYTKEKFRTDPEGKRDLVKCMEMAYSLAKEIQRRTGVAVIHQYLTERNALLYLRLEEEGKDTKHLKEDILYARERYSVLLQDQEDYFEFGMLKKSGRELYSMTICHRQLVRCYNQLIELADTDDEKAGYFEQAQQHCREMIQYAEGEIRRDEQGKVTDQLERLANFYNTAGCFLAADNNPTHLDEALEVYRKAYQLEKGQGRVDYPLSDALFGLTEGLIRRGHEGDFSKAQVFATELLSVYKANWPEKTRDIEKAKALLEKVTDLIKVNS
ncbi:Hypp1062 [Branchiostoma lanceolatum]|nr:Hypp1062 [Branchiostoma lanceolatum]